MIKCKHCGKPFLLLNQSIISVNDGGKHYIRSEVIAKLHGLRMADISVVVNVKDRSIRRRGERVLQELQNDYHVLTVARYPEQYEQSKKEILGL
jgi:hypothetical protein